MKKQKYTYSIYGFAAIIFLLRFNLVDALPNVSNQITFQEGEFSIGDIYCAEEQKNSDWCADEIPHKVKLKSFSLDKDEVTNSEYMKCFAEGICNPNDLHETRPKDFSGVKQPVVFVTWEDAQIFCKWIIGHRQNVVDRFPAWPRPLDPHESRKYLHRKYDALGADREYSSLPLHQGPLCRRENPPTFAVQSLFHFPVLKMPGELCQARLPADQVRFADPLWVAK